MDRHNRFFVFIVNITKHSSPTSLSRLSPNILVLNELYQTDEDVKYRNTGYYKQQQKNNSRSEVYREILMGYPFFRLIKVCAF